MAEILPLRAWRYSELFQDSMEELIAPLFDVVSHKQQEMLYQHPFNSIHLSLPKGESPAETARRTLNSWKKKGVLQQDFLPGIYVYYQYFRLPGEQIERCRKGFIAQLKAYDWEERKILRHEHTIASSVKDRVELLQKTKIQVSPTHGLYEDPTFELEKFMDVAIEAPIYELEDYQGVREVLAVIQDRRVIQRFLRFLSDKQVILADGHHRLEGSIQVKKLLQGSAIHSKWKAHEYHLMYLTNASSDDLKILPTHRLFYQLEMSHAEFLNHLQEWFTIKKFPDGEEIGSYAFHKPRTFGLLLGEESYFLQLKAEVFDRTNPDQVAQLRNLDLSVLHDVIFYHILGLSPEAQRHSSQIGYERNFSRCLREVRSGEASFAVITRELAMKQILDVCHSGELMPQKSTYFYPKALSGLLFASIDQDEFDYPYDTYFDESIR